MISEMVQIMYLVTTANVTLLSVKLQQRRMMTAVNSDSSSNSDSGMHDANSVDADRTLTQ